VSREQVERGVNFAETFGVDQPILPLSGGALGLGEKSPKILARCLAIPRLVSAADDDVQAGPTPLAKIVAPSSEERVQLLQLDTHGKAVSRACEARARMCSWSRSKSTTPSARTLSTSVRARHSSSAGAFDETVGGEDVLASKTFAAACTSRICVRFS
jgi:hypothetical protein